jgi:mutator protein MutT
MVEVAAGILVDGRSILACQRADHAAHARKWEFPGGKREPGESLARCLERELREELGIDVRVGALVWRTRHEYPGREPVELHFFRVETIAGTPANLAFADIRWVPIGELARLDFLDADRPLVERLDRGEIQLDEHTRDTGSDDG